MRIIFLLAFTLAGGIAHAQDSSPQAGTQPKPAAPTWEIDVRWAPWLGCWRSEDDLTGTGLRLCITPESVAGVKMLTLVDEDLRMTETVIPDKVTRPIADKECRGTSRSEWSRSSQQGVPLHRRHLWIRIATEAFRCVLPDRRANPGRCAVRRSR